MVPEIEETNCDKVKELHANLREELHKVKIIPPLTSGGLEAVNTVLVYLYWAQVLAQKEIDQRRTQKVQTDISANQPKPVAANPTNIKKPVSPALPQPQTPKISAPISVQSKSAPRPKPKSSLDFGKFVEQNNNNK